MKAEKEATMNYKIQKIELVKPIKLKVMKSEDPEDFGCYYKAVLKLTEPPNEKWKDSFYEHYKFEAFYSSRKIKISDDLIIVPIPKIPLEIPSPIPPEITSDIREQIDYIKKAIDKANTEHEKTYQEKIRERERDKIAREKQEEELRTLQDELDKISFD